RRPPLRGPRRVRRGCGQLPRRGRGGGRERTRRRRRREDVVATRGTRPGRRCGRVRGHGRTWREPGADPPGLAAVRRRPLPDGSVSTVFAAPLSDQPPVRGELAFGVLSLPDVRALVTRIAAEAGIAGRASEDLVIAANEVATNSLRHGGGAGTVAVWREDRGV